MGSALRVYQESGGVAGEIAPFGKDPRTREAGKQQETFQR